MNKYLENLSRVEFVITSACTGKCKHCSQGERKSSEHIDKNIAANTVRTIAKKIKINSVMTFGGEPLLYPETACAIHSAAKEVNIPHRQLITNGYFSEEIDKIKMVAEMLSECGVNDILLSVDAFHQETIPFEYVKVFVENVKKYNVPLRAHPAWLGSSNEDNVYNIRTRILLLELAEMGINASNGNVVFPAGNALKYFSEYFALNNTELNPYKEDPFEIKAISISANGDVLGGNIYKQNINEILSCYVP